MRKEGKNYFSGQYRKREGRIGIGRNGGERYLIRKRRKIMLVKEREGT